MDVLATLSNLVGRLAPGLRTRSAKTCPEGLPGEDAVFSAAVTALGAKLARADGRADAVEYQAFAEVFAAEPRSERVIRRFYDLARGTTLGFEGYARKLGERYRSCPSLLERVLDGLFHVARADGAVTPAEISYLQRVADLFGLSPLSFRRIKAEHLGLAADDPYALLGVAPDATDDSVRDAWRQALKEAHPDRAMGRGLPIDLVEAAAAKSQALNAAFDRVMRERRRLDEMQPA